MRLVPPVLIFAALATPAAANTPATSCPNSRSLALPPKTGTTFDTRVYSGGGVRVRIVPSSGQNGFTFQATTPMAGWRVCSMAGDGWRVPGSTGAGGRPSVAIRGFRKLPGRIVVTVAPRSAADGASCANPYIVSAGYRPPLGDGSAGRIRVVDDERQVAAPGGSRTVTRHLQWQSAIGYRTCYAAGLGALGFGVSRAFVDHRHADSLSRVLDTFGCCPNHQPDWFYAYAAFART